MTLTSIVDKISLKGIIIFMLLATAGVALQAYHASIGREFTHYDNYVIFKYSFINMTDHNNLYVTHPKTFDYYKYSPTFAIYMGLFAKLPDMVGLILFDIINTIVFIYAISKLKFTPTVQRNLFICLLLEAGITITHSQTNMLIAALILLAFTFFEDDQPLWASLCIVLTMYIKLFGVAAFCLWLLYPNKLRFIFYTLMWAFILLAAPLIFIPYKELIWQYHNWGELLKKDHDTSVGESFLGIIYSWFHLSFNKFAVVLVAGIIFLLPFVKTRFYNDYIFKLLIVTSLLIWIVIFNHRGESPSYIIALTGVGIWYFAQAPSIWRTTLFITCILFTSFSSTDLVLPQKIIDSYVEHYSIKAVFCTIIWGVIVYELLTGKWKPNAQAFVTLNKSL